MDGESEPNPAVAEEAGEQVEPMDATQSPHQPATPPQGTKDAVSMETEDGVTIDGVAKDSEDDVVVLDEGAPQPSSTTPSQDMPSTDCHESTAASAAVDPSKAVTPPLDNSPPAISSEAVPSNPSSNAAEPIIIDDEEEDTGHKDDSNSPRVPPGDSSSHSPGTLSSTEPDSEIRISSVTTLGQRQTLQPSMEDDADMSLMITSVTSLQGDAAAIMKNKQKNCLQDGESLREENDLQISNTFTLNTDSLAGQPQASFNPGRGSGSAGELVQNGDTDTHNKADSWISQSASAPRNHKQTGVDSPSPATSLPKPPGQSSSSSPGSQAQPRTVKVTCANCKKPLKKGQTAYQRKGSTHLFCSTTCLSAFSHKPAPKKSCTMCKKDITNMKGTIVAQVDSSESFQEFCSTGCLAAYENKQNTPKPGLKTKCTVCGKLTEIRHEVSFKTVTHKICSDACFNVYRRANGLIMNCCEQCGDYLPNRASANHFLLVDGQQKRFCCHNCLRDFKQAHSKLASCRNCKTLIKTGEVLHSFGPGGTMGTYCSVSCMNKGKLSASTFQNAEPTCHFCKRNSLPQYQATLPEGNVLNFCSSQCVTKFQNATLQTNTNGQTSVSNDNEKVQLKCNYCRGAFSMKPETLEWEDKVYHFCSKVCCDDYKKLHCIVTSCEYCQEEKTLHETVNVSGVKKPFCSEGCKLLFKQDFIKRLGLKCVTCNHCSQLCKRGVTRQLGGMTRDFCSETCAKRFHDWYHKAARCDCCKVQGNLTESVMWRTEMKHFCDQQCLLKFYLQQNDPIMVTQKGPENTNLGLDVQGAKVGLVNQGTVPYASGNLIRDVKNKAVLCKPLTLTKATYCKPHMQSKHLQTDADDGVKREFIPVPIPVPVYIPMPMNMYTQVTPMPFSMPVPLPVPVFVPTTLSGADEIVRTLNELKSEMAPDLPETDPLSGESISEDQKPDVKPVKVKGEQSGAETSCLKNEKVEIKEDDDDKYEPDLDLEADFPQGSDQIRAVEGTDNAKGLSLPPVSAEENEEQEKKSPEEPLLRPRPKRTGSKKMAVERGSDSSLSSSPLAARQSEGSLLHFKACYGINAWKRWVLMSSDSKVKDNKQALPWPKSNLLSLSSEELNVSLSRFVREVCRPGGERYSPDSILYLCLGIQQYLHSKGRTDDLFSDPCFDQFGEELNTVLKDWKPSVLSNGSPWSRLGEESLWSSQQLGEHSPATLLRSLVYLNTKYFGLRTVEQHLQLSFANVYGPDTVHPVTKEITVCIRVPSISQDHPVQTGSRKRKRKLEDDSHDHDPDDDSGGSTALSSIKENERRLYELYRSKCPTLLSESSDVFYVQPDPTVGPDAALWFSSTPLERETLERLLTRVLMVRDVYTEPKHVEGNDKGVSESGEQVDGE
ncbi:zinc finger MYM-type protein 2 isoform 1-T2 [Synchiropus picturatus]